MLDLCKVAELIYEFLFIDPLQAIKLLHSNLSTIYALPYKLLHTYHQGSVYPFSLVSISMIITPRLYMSDLNDICPPA